MYLDVFGHVQKIQGVLKFALLRCMRAPALGSVLVIDLKQPLFLRSIGINLHVEEVGLGAGRVMQIGALHGHEIPGNFLALCQLKLHHKIH